MLLMLQITNNGDKIEQVDDIIEQIGAQEIPRHNCDE